jgi:hypothetical protein
MTVPDLTSVDDLCRLAHAARRLGCRAHLVGADAELHALLELAGVADVLCDCPAARNPPDPTPMEGGLRWTP